MRSPSSSSLTAGVASILDRDADVTRFVGSIVDSARQHWGDRIIAEGNGTFDPRLLYTETHYALAAVLLFLQDRSDRSLLDLAQSRLRLWATGTYPLTFFNAMAICLASIALKRSDVEHAGLSAVLDELIADTREHRHVAYDQLCGNNAYLQQVAVDTVLLPVARRQRVTPDGLSLLLSQFHSFRTPEGLFFDLPRNGVDHERLAPPTYIMKMLFLLGMCHELHPRPELAELFTAGMSAVRPLLTRDGHFSYFGRTDNSPFGIGLTIFNLRKAAQLNAGARSEYHGLARRAEHFYLTFPRTASGVLESNRFGDAKSAAESWYSKDAYAYVAQYSLASCAYAMLGVHWFPAPRDEPVSRADAHAAAPAVSNDLGVVKLVAEDREIVVRTRSEITSWDRRYQGPTILRYSIGDTVLIGAISKTVSTDRTTEARQPGNAARKLFELLRYPYVHGPEHLDATTVGFVPVLRRGAVDYLPYTLLSVEASPTTVSTRHEMLRLNARGLHPCMIDALQLVRGRIPGLEQKRYVQPAMRPAPSIQLTRTIALRPDRCRLEDRITGDLSGKHLIFSVRRMPGASIEVRGLAKLRSIVGWGSDGRQTLDLYSATPVRAEIAYECDIVEDR